MARGARSSSGKKVISTAHCRPQCRMQHAFYLMREESRPFVSWPVLDIFFQPVQYTHRTTDLDDLIDLDLSHIGSSHLADDRHNHHFQPSRTQGQSARPSPRWVPSRNRSRMRQSILHSCGRREIALLTLLASNYTTSFAFFEAVWEVRTALLCCPRRRIARSADCRWRRPESPTSSSILDPTTRR